MSEAMNENVFVPVMLPAAMVQPTEQIEEYPDIPAAIVNSEIIEEVPVIDNSDMVQGYTTILHCTMDQSVFKEITKTLTALVPEVRMHISHDDLIVRCVDIANVAMVDIVYRKESFESFKVIDHHAIGIDLAIWQKFLKNVKKNNSVLFEVVRKELPSNKTEEDIKKDITVLPVFEYTYKLSCNGTEITGKTLDVNTIRRDPNMPSVVLPTKIDLTAGDLIETIRGAHDVSDKIELSCNEKALSDNVLKAIAEYGTSKSVKVVNTLSITGDGARSIFSLDYLIDIVKAIQDKKEIVTIDMGNDHPIKITLSNVDREIIYLLAPRIEAN